MIFTTSVFFFIFENSRYSLSPQGTSLFSVLNFSVPWEQTNSVFTHLAPGRCYFLQLLWASCWTFHVFRALSLSSAFINWIFIPQFASQFLFLWKRNQKKREVPATEREQPESIVFAQEMSWNLSLIS